MTGQADLARAQPSLKTQAAAGVKWTGASTAGRTVLQFAQIAVLAHLLSPSDFGLMGMMLVVLGFAEAFADMGISNAIIHRQNATREQLSSLYWLNMLSGIVVFAAVWAAAPLIVSLFHERRLAGLVFWVALIFVITPVGQQFQILLQKELRFRTLAAVEVTATGVGVAVSIVAAFLGQGVLSLIWGQLANAATRSTLLAGIGWRAWPPALRFQRSDLKGYLSFGLYQMGERSMNFLSANVDYLMIARFLGSGALGIYAIAYQLAVMPMTRINPILTRVAFPVLSKRQADNAALRYGYLKMTELLAITVLPILAGLAVAAPVLIPLVFGPSWNASIPLVRILSALGILKALGNPVGSVLLAKGRADIGFKWNLLVAAANTLAFWAAAPHGVHMVAVSYVAASCVYFVLLRMILGAVIGLEWAEYVASLSRPAAASGAAGVLMLGTHLLLAGTVGGPLLLAAMVAVGGIGLAWLSVRLERDFLIEMWGLLGRGREGVDRCQG